MNNDKIKEEVAEQIKQDCREEQYESHRKYVDGVIQYALKEGFLDADEVLQWSEDEKEAYIKACEAYEPEQEDFTGATEGDR